mgnify:CR=1 FL=1
MGKFAEIFRTNINVGRAAKRKPLPERKDSYDYSNLIPEHKMKDEKTMNEVKIPDEVTREIELAKVRESTIREVAEWMRTLGPNDYYSVIGDMIEAKFLPNSKGVKNEWS